MRICPLCNFEAPHIIKQYTSEQVANTHVVRNINPDGFKDLKDHLEVLWNNRSVNVRRCFRCDFCFADPFVSGDAKFYELSSFDTAYPTDKWEFQRTLDMITKSDRDARILEIGSGKGHFLRKLINLGFLPNNLLAVEYSSTGMRAIKDMDVECLDYDIRQYKTDRQFDIICMFQILEHLDGYDTLFAKLRQIMTDKAQLFISVPYGKRIEKNEQLGLLWDCPPNHVTRWMPQSLAMLADKYGFNLTETKLEPTTTKYELSYALVNRFVRRSQDIGSWPNRITALSKHMANKRQERAVKLAGALTTPSAWLATLKAYKTVVSPTIWAQFIAK